jgi:CHAT domain-containing protein/tetratricopeptide (TPR) repeat protein
MVVRNQLPRLLYVPSAGTTTLDDHNQLVHLLATLKDTLGRHWKEELLEELAVVPPNLLCAELNATTTTPAHSVGEVVDAFIQADTVWKQQYVLSRYPEIYEADAEEVAAVFEERRDSARRQGNHAMLGWIRMQKGMLAGCRSSGAGTIRSLIPSSKVYESGTQVNELLLAGAHSMRSGKKHQAAVLLSHAAQDLPKAVNPLLWAEIHLTIAELAAELNSDQHMSARQAYEMVTTATFPCGPWRMRWAESHAGLAGLCTEQPDLAVTHYELAVEAFKALDSTQQLSMMYDALGFLESQRTDGDRARHLDEALRHFRAGADCIDRDGDPSSWAAMQFNLGNAYLERVNGDPAENLQLATHHLQQAAEVQGKLAENARYQESLERLRLAQQRALELPLRDPRSADLTRALRALENYDWYEALAAYRSAIEQTEQMLVSVHSEQDRRRVFSDFGTAYSAAAYIHLRLGQFSEAIALIEGGRSRILSEEMQAFDVVEEKLPPTLRAEVHAARRLVRDLRALKFIPMKSDPAASRLFDDMNRGARQKWVEVLARVKEVAPEAVRAEIGERELIDLVPVGGALVLPVLSIVGCCVLVVPHGLHALSSNDLLWIDEFTDYQLTEMLTGWVGSQDTWDRAKRRNAIRAECERLWRVLMCHVADRLAAVKLGRGAPVIVLPQGGLGALPLHAAAPASDSRETFLDAYSVSYAPSAYLLSRMQRRAAEPTATPGDFLGAVDPLGDLDYGRAEGALIASLFEHPALLEGPAANGGNLVQGVVDKKYVHLSCHAYFTSLGGNYSGLYLAHDAVSLSSEALQAAAEGRPALEEYFPVGQRWIVHNLKLSRCRLVTLSACESGRVDVRHPDEFLGLPAAFLRAGAAAVVSSLWRVDDVAAMLVTRRLYEGLVRDELTPGRALRQAQLWLRDATNQTLYRFYRTLRDQGLAAFAKQKLDREMRRHGLGAPNERPFADPYYWAAFVVIGND